MFTDCYNVSGLRSYAGPINKTFTAPNTPGVYYLTQVSSWEYNCYDRGAGNPGNNPADAIAVVVVNVSNATITASTTADAASPAGIYPITLQACDNYNANYEVTLQNGTLNVGGVVGPTRAPGGLETENTVAEIFGDKLYPNPASSLVRLQLKADVQRTSDIQVYDRVGKLSRVVVKKVNEKAYDIDISALPKGVYFVNVKTSTGFTTFRFVKM